MRRTPGLHDRAIAYGRTDFARKWPDSSLVVSASGQWLYGHWCVGSLFSNTSRYPGAFPRTMLERLRALFPEVRENRVLHLFSGSLAKGRHTRVDVNPETKPDIVGHVYELPQLIAGRPRFDLVIADPPYTANDARARYQTAPVNKARVFRAIAAASALPAGTHVAWLDSSVPMYRKDQWHRWGFITVERSTGHVIRGWHLFTRKSA